MDEPGLFSGIEQPPAPALRTDGPFAAVAIEASLDRVLDYRIPAPLVPTVRVGQRVSVPLGRNNRPTYGYVTAVSATSRTVAPIKPILRVDDTRVLVPPKLLELATWMSRYYCCPLGTVLETIIPAAVKKRVGLGYTPMVRLAQPREKIQEMLAANRRRKRGAILARLLLMKEDEAVDLHHLAREAGVRPPTVRQLVKLGLITITPEPDFASMATPGAAAAAVQPPPPEPNEDQRRALAELLPRLGAGFSVTLLFGVTGSGKTEVYLRCIEEVVRQGRRAIVLVPEIALTPQTVRRFTARLPRVAVLHSGLSASVRHRFWQQIAAGMADVVVGARSAVFAPMPDLGMIVVDEEHEFSYKQDTAPRYQARDVAIKRGQLENVPVLLGSATPSLESWWRAGGGFRVRGSGFSGEGVVGVQEPEVGGEGGFGVQGSGFRAGASDEATERRSDGGEGRGNDEARNPKPERMSNDEIRMPASVRTYDSGPGTENGTGDEGPDDPLPPRPQSQIKNQKSKIPHLHLLTLPQRVRGLALPQVEIVDMKTEVRLRRPGIHLISRRLEYLIRQTVDAGHQAILLLNRRGYASFVYCSSCQSAVQCKYCDATMTYHRAAEAHAASGRTEEGARTGQLHCHYCLAAAPLPVACPQCGKKLSLFGLGTQRVEEELARKYPDIRFARVDSDSMRSARDYEQTLEDFATGRIQVMLGTQMIAKGLDYPNVTLVGVISADTALSLPDFRAAERTFQLITQVAGRAGRGDAPGRVIVQSFMPNDPTIQAAIRQDFPSFAAGELKARLEVGLPPVTRMVRIVLRDQELSKLQQRAAKLSEALTAALAAATPAPPVTVKGPMPCTIGRIAGFHRMQVLLYSVSAARLAQVLGALRERGAIADTQRIAVDVDPVWLL